MTLWFDDLARFREEAYFRARDAELIAQSKKNDASTLANLNGPPIEQTPQAEEVNSQGPEKPQE